MPSLSIQHDAAPADGPFVALAATAAAMLRAVASWHARAVQRRVLAELDPRMMRDIGLSPVDRRNETAKPFWRG